MRHAWALATLLLSACSSDSASHLADCEVHFIQDGWDTSYQIDYYNAAGLLDRRVDPIQTTELRYGYDSRKRQVLESWDRDADGVDDARTWWLFEGDKLDRIEDDINADDVLDSWTSHDYDAGKLVHTALHDHWNDDRIIEETRFEWQGDKLITETLDGDGDGVPEVTDAWEYDDQGRAVLHTKARASREQVESWTYTWADLDGGGYTRTEQYAWDGQPNYQRTVTAYFPDGRLQWVEQQQRESGFVYQRDEYTYDTYKRLTRIETDWNDDHEVDFWQGREYVCGDSDDGEPEDTGAD